VINTSNGAFASINNHMVKLGGVVNGAKIVAIKDFSVEMELNGERFVVAIDADTYDTPDENSSDENAGDDQPDHKRSGRHSKSEDDSKPSDKRSGKSADNSTSKPADSDSTAPDPTPSRGRSAPPNPRPRQRIQPAVRHPLRATPPETRTTLDPSGRHT